MMLVTRKRGSQRTSKAVDVTFEPAFFGQNGSTELVLFNKENNEYTIIDFDSIEEVRELMSQAAIIYSVWGR